MRKTVEKIKKAVTNLRPKHRWGTTAFDHNIFPITSDEQRDTIKNSNYSSAHFFYVQAYLHRLFMRHFAESQIPKK